MASAGHIQEIYQAKERPGTRADGNNNNRGNVELV